MDKIWASATACNAVCAGAGFTSLVSKQSTINGFGYAASNAGSDYSAWNGKKTLIANSKTIVCSYSGAVKTITLCPGTYKLEVWGAQGGAAPTHSKTGGLGGYSYGNKTISAATVYYIYVGGQGNTCTVSGAVKGGYNGGGGITGEGSWGSTVNHHGTGGGATDIATVGGECTVDSYQRYVRSADSYSSRLLVGGGGGGADAVAGGAGGGTSGGGTNAGTASTAGGNTSSSYHSWYAGALGYGASCTGGHPNHAMGAPGGGGYYGGGIYGNNGQSGYGAGGSGYIGGVTGGSTTAGQRSGHGYAQITRISA